MTENVDDLPKDISPIDMSDWALVRPDMRITQHKLRLFDFESVPLAEFFYLDLTLMITKSLGDILEQGRRSSKPLVILRDWRNMTVNSCFMRIRTSNELSQVTTDYINGVHYDCRLSGDQDYLDASLSTHGLFEHVDYFDQSQIASYKQLRRMNRKDKAQARLAFERACIVKFHGQPRPHELLDWKWRIRHATHSPGHLLQDWGFLSTEVRRHWRDI